MLPFELGNADDIPSPALLILRERVEDNTRRMIARAGGPSRLCPHVKTHKLGELVRRQIELGIRRFKCATIAEAEMAATAGAPEVLLALQPVGPNTRRFVSLVSNFPQTRFATVVDDTVAVRDLSREARETPMEVLIDLDIGQHRTGVEPGPKAMDLVRTVISTPGMKFGGLHAYDGHIHDRDVAARKAAADVAFAPVAALWRQLEEGGIAVPRVVAGGTPTFPFHATRPRVECSPGTCVFWDAGYATNLPDLDFQPAAVLLTRVVSRPAADRLCLDLGHKSVASEMPHPRVLLLNLPEARAIAHNEEHMVVETPHAADWNVGDCVYGIPWHICPTVALYSEVWVVDDNRARERWQVLARNRRLTL